MDDKFKDLLEDEELTALRLEALASKKRKLENANNSSDSVSALPINSIVTSSTSDSASNVIPFVQSDRNAYNNYTWRKQNQSSRRRGGSFPKSNQRSNLIIISPVSLNDDKDSTDKIPALILPQHKWCNSGNEDSMSPKTLRRTGPTRFNRHGSDSDSSDSDYENSENDSGSNETVLQDEPPEHYSCLSPKDDAITENVEKQRRLSFQNLENEIQSDTFEKSETTSVYNCLKNSSSLDYTKNKSDSFVPVQNITDNRHDWNSSANNEYNSYKKYNSGHSYATKPVDSTDNFVENQSSCVVSNGESQISKTSGLISQSSDTSVWQHSGVKANNLYYSRDISKVHEIARNHGLNDRKSRDYSDNRHTFQMNSEIQGSESSVWKHGEKVRLSNSYFSRDSTCSKTLPRNYCDDNVNSKEKMLSGDDLRFELKKRMQEMQPKSTDHENCNELIGNQTSDQSSIRDRNKHRYIYEEDRIDDLSHSNIYGSRQELNLRNRQKRSFSKERDEHSMNLNRRRYHRSLSREKNKQENSGVRDKSRSEYNFGSDRSRYDRSSSLDRNKYSFNSNRGRNRLERSSSRDRFERSSSRGRFERSSSRGRIERSSSRGRNERSSSRGRNERSSSRGRTQRSSSRGRSQRSSSRGRTQRSSSRGRSKRSSSRGRHRHGWESNSSKSKIAYESNVEDSSKLEQSLNQERKKYEYSSSQESDHNSGRRGSHQEQTLTDDKGKHTRSRSRYEHRYSPGRKEYVRSSSRERGKNDHWSSHNHSRSDRSSSRDSRDDHSSSSDSQHERSLSQDRSRHDYSSSQERNRHKRSRSRDQSKHKHSRSRDTSRHRKSPNLPRHRHERSQSLDSSKHTGSQDRNTRERSASHDKKKYDYTSKKGGSGDDSSEIKSRHEHNSDGSKNSYKSISSKGKSKLGVTSGEEKDKIESTSGQENVECYRNLQSKKSDSTRNSERTRDDKRGEKTNTKEQFVTGDRNRQIRSRSKEKFKGSKKVSLKSSRAATNSEYETKYSRSRSSSTSRSSSSSSSSSQNLRHKIRSVPSVIKSFLPKSVDTDKKETFCEVKLTGKNISTSHSEDNFSSSRKDAIDYKLSNVKCGRVDGDSKASDNSKRVPVHMRLGALPRKRLMHMSKDVEAAFVNSSSSSDGENVNTKCKRQDIRIVTDVYGSKSSGFDSETKHPGKEKPPKRSSDLYQEKSKRMKTHR